MTAAAVPLLKQRADDLRVKVPAAVAVLYENTMAFINASGFADDDTASGVNRFGGMVVKQVDNSGGSAGDLAVELETDGSWVFLGSGFAQSSVGLPLFALDNQTTTLTALAGTRVGVITEYIDSTHVRAAIEGFEGVATGSAYTQTYTTALKTVPAATAANVGTTNATTTTPWGFATSTQANDIGVAMNATQADVLALKKVINALIDDLQAAGIVG
jgi:hypothetical protein